MAAARIRGRVDRSEPAPEARGEPFTIMLMISLGALLLGCVLLFLDYSQFPSGKPPAISPPPPRAQPQPTAPGAP
jgi:hypothetical protein